MGNAGRASINDRLTRSIDAKWKTRARFDRWKMAVQSMSLKVSTHDFVFDIAPQPRDGLWKVEAHSFVLAHAILRRRACREWVARAIARLPDSFGGCHSAACRAPFIARLTLSDVSLLLPGLPFCLLSTRVSRSPLYLHGSVNSLLVQHTTLSDLNAKLADFPSPPNQRAGSEFKTNV